MYDKLISKTSIRCDDEVSPVVQPMLIFNSFAESYLVHELHPISTLNNLYVISINTKENPKIFAILVAGMQFYFINYY